MNYDGKKLSILGGTGPHVKVVESAHEMGIQTIVADYLPDSPAKSIADVALMNNIYDIDELVQYGKENKIDGVLGFSLDPTQKPAHQIAANLGLPVCHRAKKLRKKCAKFRSKRATENGTQLL